MLFKRKSKLSREAADMEIAKMMLADQIESIKAMKKGVIQPEKPMSYYDNISDKLCGQPSRHIY